MPDYSELFLQSSDEGDFRGAIGTAEHCCGCSAGEGSSCGGAPAGASPSSAAATQVAKTL